MNTLDEDEIVWALSPETAISLAKHKLGEIVDGNQVTSVSVSPMGLISAGRFVVSYGYRNYDPIGEMMEQSSFVFYVNEVLV